MVDNEDYEVFDIDSDLHWLKRLPHYIKNIYLDELLDKGVINEIHNEYTRILFWKKLVKSEYVGVWGWNTWCGIHTFPILIGDNTAEIYKNTVEVGFARTEPGTNLLPHAVLHNNGIFGSKPTYKCYGGQHGETYNLGNMLGWAKMAMEYVLYSNDLAWFDKPKLQIITDTINYILENFREKYNPHLIYTGIEGDWTECTDWELDNANVNVNMLRTLELYIECLKLFGMESTIQGYKGIRKKMREEFNKSVNEGGFWSEECGHYIHGNDGTGANIHGDRYFESTVNYFSVLWDVIPHDYEELLWSYLTAYGDKIEFPYPVLTNYRPRTSARRTNYGRTVTNGDVWLVLGAHATAARLKSGFINRGSRMYKTIIEYEMEHGVFHNSLYQNGTVNDSWDPEVANNGAPFPPLIYGVLGIKPLYEGIEFNIRALSGLSCLKTDLFLFGKKHELKIKWNNNIVEKIVFKKIGTAAEEERKVDIDACRFMVYREEPHEIIQFDN